MSHHPNRSVVSRRASGESSQALGSNPTPRRMPSHRSLFRPPFLDRSGLRPTLARGPTMPSADFYGAVPEDGLHPQSCRTPRRNLPWSAVVPSVHRRRMYQAQPHCGWRALLCACQLAPAVPHLISGSCPSPRTCVPRILETPPHGDALALPLSFGSTHTWTGDFHSQA